MIKIIFIGAMIFLFNGCQQKHTKVYRSFYFWKTTMNFSASENSKLDSLHIEKLYTRLFDVDFSDQPITRGIIDIQKLPENIMLIPVVYITNKTLLNISDPVTLADNISSLINKILQQHKIKTEEVQIDCDWSLQTKELYFALLKRMQDNFPAQKISCTIRLHQVKYMAKTGIPPVQKGMLMFYNMGDIKAMDQNSIYNEQDAKRYVRFVKEYPLPLDVALPLFGWIKQYRFGKMNALINNISADELRPNNNFAETQHNHFAVVNNTILHGNFFQKNDTLVQEEIIPETTLRAALLLNKYLTTDNCSVILYHWDANNIHQHEIKPIEKIYSVFE